MNDLFFVRQHVVNHMAIHGCRNFGCSCFDVTHKLQQAFGVVTFWKPFAIHQPAFFKHGIRIQKTVGGYQFDARMLWPTHQKRLQNSCRSAFTDRNAARNANHIGHLWRHRAKKRRRHAMQVLRRRNIQVQQSSQRQINRRHFFKINAIVDAAHRFEFFFGECQRRLRT